MIPCEDCNFELSPVWPGEFNDEYSCPICGISYEWNKDKNQYTRIKIMRTDWDKAIEFVLKMEGEYTLDPDDPGGETMYGISKKAYPSINIKSLTIDEAKAIYLRDYWIPCNCDDLPTAFAVCVFDTAVNMGTGKAKRMLQMALDVEVDGIIGSETLSAASRAGRSRVRKYLALRLAEYARIMATNINLLKYSLNWSYRVLHLMDTVN